MGVQLEGDYGSRPSHKLSNEKTLTEKNSPKRYCDRGQR